MLDPVESTSTAAPVPDAGAGHWTDPLAYLVASFVLSAGRYSRQVQWVLRGGRSVPGTVPFGVTADDGVRLAALYCPAAKRDPLRLPVVIAHGWAETKESRRRQALLVNAAGHDAILLDLRAHGRSGGRWTTFGVRERHDLKAVIDEAQRRGWVPADGAAPGRVITMGLSLGGGTVLQHAAIDDRVAGVVALAPFADFTKAVQSYRGRYARWLNEAWVRRGFVRACAAAGFERAGPSTLAAVARLRVPALLIVGTRDRNLPAAEHTRPLARAAPTGLCTVIEAPGAHHFNISGAGWPGVDQAIVEFCAKVSRAGKRET